MKKFIKKFAMFAVVLLGVTVFSVTSINASGNGSGNGGSWTGGSEASHWKILTGREGTREAYNKLLSRHIRTNEAGLDARLNSMGVTSNGKSLSQICKVSEEIWVVTSYNQGKWVMAQSILGSNNIDWDPHAPWGSQAPLSRKELWRGYTNSSIYNQWGRGQVVIICSGVLPPTETKGKPAWEADGNVPSTFKDTRTYTIQKGTKVDLKDRGTWKGTAQPMNNKSTPIYDNFLKNNSVTKLTTPDQWKAWVKNAEKHSQDVDNEITLNAHNEQKMLEGGVMDVTEYKQTVTYSIELTGSQKKEKEYIPVYNSSGKLIRKEYTGKTRLVGNVSYKGGGKEVKTGLVPDKQWQVVTVRCNADEFQTLMKAVSGKVYSTEGARGFNVGYTTPVAYSSSAILPLGNKNHSNSLVRTTSNDTFFTKTSSCETSFVCTPAKGGTVEESKYNVFKGKGVQELNQDTGQIVEDEVNVFEFFRDNEPKTVRANISYPKVIGGNSGEFYHISNKASQTLVARDPKGTPIDEGLFTLSTEKGRIDFIKHKIAMNAQYNRLNAQAAWASDDGKPHRLNLTWVYGMGIKGDLPITVNGKKIIKGKKVDGKVDVFCDFRGADESEVKKPKMSTSGGKYEAEDFTTSKSFIELMFNRSVAQ